MGKSTSIPHKILLIKGKFKYLKFRERKNIQDIKHLPGVCVLLAEPVCWVVPGASSTPAGSFHYQLNFISTKSTCHQFNCFINNITTKPLYLSNQQTQLIVNLITSSTHHHIIHLIFQQQYLLITNIISLSLILPHNSFNYHSTILTHH
jgi:hypothetical protein